MTNDDPEDYDAYIQIGDLKIPIKSVEFKKDFDGSFATGQWQPDSPEMRRMIDNERLNGGMYKR